MEDRKLTEQESLQLISQMIRNAKEKVEKNAGVPFLIWGYTTVAIALAVWYMVTTTHNPAWHWLWFAIIAIGLPMYLLFYSRAKEQQPSTKTYVDRVMTNTWVVIGGSALLVGICAMFVRIPVLFIMLLMMGIGTTLTGLLIRFKAIIVSGVLSVCASFICLFINPNDQILVFALVFALMMVVPGHILNYSARKQYKI